MRPKFLRGTEKSCSAREQCSPVASVSFNLDHNHLTLTTSHLSRRNRLFSPQVRLQTVLKAQCQTTATRAAEEGKSIIPFPHLFLTAYNLRLSLILTLNLLHSYDFDEPGGDEGIYNPSSPDDRDNFDDDEANLDSAVADIDEAALEERAATLASAYADQDGGNNTNTQNLTNGGDQTGGGGGAGAKPTSDADKKIPDDKRTTTPFMTKYERARVLGTRALQIRCVHSMDGESATGLLKSLPYHGTASTTTSCLTPPYPPLTLHSLPFPSSQSSPSTFPHFTPLLFHLIQSNTHPAKTPPSSSISKARPTLSKSPSKNSTRRRSRSSCGATSPTAGTRTGAVRSCSPRPLVVSVQGETGGSGARLSAMCPLVWYERDM